MISLSVVVIPALRPDPAPDPWVELVGGPGNAATDFARSYTEDWRAFRQDRDVLLIDQRGTGNSNGLYCAELALHRVSSLFPRFPNPAVRKCRKRLSKLADLAQYSTLNAARDIETVRQRLDYAQVNLFGSSYGTRLALEYIRQYPDNVRSATLWGVVTPDFRRPLFYARDGQRALDRLIEECLADAECRDAYPDISGDLAKTLENLKQAPRTIAIRNPSDGRTHKVKMTAAGFAQAVWVALSYPDQAHRLPEVLSSAASGDFEPFVNLDVATKPPRRTYYNAMHLSVACPEETGHIKSEELAAAYHGAFMPLDRALEYVQACRAWSLPPSPAELLEPVRSDAPVLIVSGEMDPITPPEWGEAAHRSLANSRHIVVRHLSHESNGLSGADCLDRLFLDFLATADPEKVDAACAAEISAPQFEVPR